jgi:2-polyprenyl-3-methyl-5-hydroxy-6-metoxy-1,4-benzoquinol methylase
MGAYVLDNAWEHERERLAGLEEKLDPGTTRYLDAIGVGAGWSCLEVAGGGGSITQWLCRRVAPTGRVVATDVDTRFLDALDEPNLQVIRHDITSDDLPEEYFDVVHARCLLEHLPERAVILKRLVRSLKPGGWILIEDMDWRSLLSEPAITYDYPPADPRSTRVWHAMATVLQNAGYDGEYGAKLPAHFIAEGLTQVSGEVRAPMVWGGTTGTATLRLGLMALRDRLVSSGLAAEDIDREIARYGDPGVATMFGPIVAAWGRRPGVAGAARPAGAMPRRRAGAVEQLKQVPLFAACTVDELFRIAALAEELEVPAGRVLAEEGKREAVFYVVVTGTASVTRAGTSVATLGPGSFFGEIALLTGGVRTATVTARTPMRLLSLEERSFNALLRDSPTMARKVLEGVSERLRDRESGVRA